MRVAVVHNVVTDDSAPDERDVLVQTGSVLNALGHLAHEVFTVPCSLDLDRVKDWLEQIRPDIVFNLVESIGGQGRLAHLFPALLDTMGLPYTGSSTLTLLVTTHKIMAKELLANSGLRTPAWIGPFPPERLSLTPAESLRRRAPGSDHWIVKSVWEHASFGMEEDALLATVAEAEIETILRKRAPRLGGSCFAEAFVDGREFNLAVLGGPDGPQILPAAEIIFDGYDVHKPKIVGYRAKWAEDSYEYHHTPRRFEFPFEDNDLLARLAADALECWRIFGIGGFARVDFRIDSHGTPWILEVNANPCLSPDAGFAAALSQAGLSYPDAVERILEDGLWAHKKINR
ncbi:MAG: D-alanine--D-alanine ligase family protein [Desulfobacterales bacterium]